MEAYKLWVLKNRELVRSLESLANWATWILPERFGNSEVAPEAGPDLLFDSSLYPLLLVYALVGIVECVNQHIVETPINESVPWALVVSILKDAEAVVEVAAQRFAGDDRKWDFLAVTEAAKACVRFAAFRESGYSRMLLHGGEVENDEAATPMNGHPQNEIACNGKAALSKNGNLQPTPTVTMEVERPSIWCWKGVSGRLFMLGEAVHIFRPLVYVLLMTKFGSRSSWTPWLVSLALEVTSLGIHSRKVHLLSSAERDELNRRKMMMWVIYAVRDPFFGKYTRPQLEKAQKALNSVPLIGLGKLVDLSEGVQSRYTYTSGS